MTIVRAQRLEQSTSRWYQQALEKIEETLSLVQAQHRFDLHIKLNGGGAHAQVAALVHALAHVLIKYDEEGGDDGDGTGRNHWRRTLRTAGLVTRDARKVERKHVGFRKARKRKQYSKR